MLGTCSCPKVQPLAGELLAVALEKVAMAAGSPGVLSGDPGPAPVPSRVTRAADFSSGLSGC